MAAAVAVLVAVSSVEAGPHARWAGRGAEACGDGCPCEAERADSNGAHAACADPACPGSDANEPCPPGCDDCLCCSGMAKAVAREARPPLATVPATRVADLEPGRPPTASPPGVYRPPRSARSPS